MVDLILWHNQNQNSMKNKVQLVVSSAICLLMLSITTLFGQGSPSGWSINDSTDARYRYDLETRHYALVEAGVTMEDIPLHKRDRLIPTHETTRISTGVNSQMEIYNEFEVLDYKLLEEWMVPPAKSFISPTHLYGYSKTGEELYRWESTDLVKADLKSLSDLYWNDGFRPIMTFFPSIRDAFSEQFQQDGGIIYENDDRTYVMQKDGRTTTVDPVNYTIEEEYILDDRKYITRTSYTLMVPYGYVVNRRTTTEQTVMPDEEPIYFITDQIYSNHVIEDPNGRVPMYTEEAHLLIHPVPLAHGGYVIELRGIEDQQVNQVVVRDYFGNVVATHNSLNIEAHLIELDASTYPPGMLIIQVITPQTIYNQTVIN